MKVLDAEVATVTDKRLFDLGCGHGMVGDELHKLGWDVTGVDPAAEGIDYAKDHFPHLKLEVGSAYDDLPGKFGTFPALISLEVVEHVYAPRTYAKTAYDLLEDGGLAVLSTPYHGYIKNLALAATGAMDKHFTALWDHGHIKFWSEKTLGTLLSEVGFKDIKFHRVGRIAPLARSMVVQARK
ncbi:MAG: class I SAM-dependent methyltransferase [Pseudomonadota bacterium]